MKNLIEYIKESQLLTEHFVNCTEPNQMKEYSDIVWKILQNAYEYCGGIKNIDGPDQLIRDTHLWKLYRKNGEIKAVIVYTDRKGGRKICFIGSDGTKEGISGLKKMMEDDFKLKDRQTWTGVSGKAAITALKHGGIPIPATIACEIMNGGKTGKCVPYDDYWYQRPLNGGAEVHYKIMVGNPPGHESIEPSPELIDKLIKQAIEFGERNHL